ncbi:MAG: BMP family protein [Chloroflexi bacterium]|nr:BMP family protein [Chloroflexota bacterium]
MNKKFTIVAAILMVATLLLASCAPAPVATQAPVVATEAPVVVTAAPTEAAPALLKVFGAYATPIEEPWDGVIHAALQKAKEDGLIDYTYTENIGYSGDMERVLREVCEQQKPDLIFGDAFVNEEAVRRVAKDYPEIAFAFGSEYGPVAPNLAVFDNWIHEPAYLSGMIAGGLTQTKTIGVVGAIPIPEVNRLINAFTAGVKETNPDAKVLVSFIGSFFDPATAKEQALAQISAGADVLYAERAGVIEAAAEKSIFAFGNMSDQNAVAPDWVITGPVWNMTPTVEYVIAQVESGTFTAIDLKDFSMFAQGGASLADFHGNDSKVPAAIMDAVKAKEEAILAGMFRVPIDEAQPLP